MLIPCSSARSESAPTAICTWSKPFARTARPSSASSAISAARKWSRPRGDLDRLARSAARLSQRSMILSLIEDGSMPDVTCRRIGAPLLFERLWQESGCRAVVEDLLAGRRFEFAVERAVFLTVLHRLMVSGSDRACEHWRDDYRIDGIDDLGLHHLYRAMTWLGEELPETRAGRCTRWRRAASRTSSRSSCLRAGATCSASSRWCSWTPRRCTSRAAAATRSARSGHTKDYRPHLNQMVVGIIMDQNGRPVCSEMWPGNTTDVTTLIPVIDRLRQRFAIGRVCVVADRGMISAETIAGLEERGLEYILGVRERSSKEVYEVVLNDPKPSVSLVIPRGQPSGHRAGGQGRVGRRAPLRGLPQPQRSQARCRGARGGAAQPAREPARRRQGARRQQRLSALSQDAGRQALRDRREAGRRGRAI